MTTQTSVAGLVWLQFIQNFWEAFLGGTFSALALIGFSKVLTILNVLLCVGLCGQEKTDIVGAECDRSDHEWWQERGGQNSIPTKLEKTKMHKI